MKSLQAVLHGALRREQHAEEEMKSLATQIAHLKRLVSGDRALESEITSSVNTRYMHTFPGYQSCAYTDCIGTVY